MYLEKKKNLKNYGKTLHTKHLFLYLFQYLKNNLLSTFLLTTIFSLLNIFFACISSKSRVKTFILDAKSVTQRS